MDEEARLIAELNSNNLTSGTGYADGCRYVKNQRPKPNDFLGFSTRLKNEHLELFAIVSGFNGGGYLTKFILNNLIVNIFKRITKVHCKPVEVIEELHRIFDDIARAHFDSSVDDLSSRFIAMNDDEQSPINIETVSLIDEKIRKGATVILLLKIDDHIYILNCGRSMAVSVMDNDGGAQQLNTILHENDDPEEVKRLISLNVEPSDVLNPTRAIGDLHRSHLYDEKPQFLKATSAPVIAVPDIYHFEIDNDWKYIVLLSDGVVQNLKEIGVEDIAKEVSFKLKENNTHNSTAQSLVDEFSRKHQDAYEKTVDEQNCSVSSQMEEMTVIFIKLKNDAGLRLTEFVDTMYSTTQSVQSEIDEGPIVPYIDIPHDTASSNLEKMKEYLLGMD